MASTACIAALRRASTTALGLVSWSGNSAPTTSALAASAAGNANRPSQVCQAMARSTEPHSATSSNTAFKACAHPDTYDNAPQSGHRDGNKRVALNLHHCENTTRRHAGHASMMTNVKLTGARRRGSPAGWRMMTDVRRTAGLPCRCAGSTTSWAAFSAAAFDVAQCAGGGCGMQAQMSPWLCWLPEGRKKAR